MSGTHDPARRRHGNEDVPPLAGRELAGSGLREVLLQRAHLDAAAGHGCAVTAWSPTLADGRAPLRPSPLLAHPPRLEPVRAWSEEERGRFEFDGHVLRAQVPFPAGTSFYGLGLVAGPLLRNGRAVVLWNTDAWCYGEESPALYQSHPFVLGVLPDGRAVGVLADTFRRARIEVARDGIELEVEQEPCDLYVIEADHPSRACQGLAALVGRMAPPPRWALGYHLCRWGWRSADEVRAVAAELRRRELPCAALWLDIDHMDRCRPFTWDPERFPDPAGLVAELQAAGHRVVAILDPGIVADPEDPTCASGLAGGHFVLDRHGRPVRGRVWPGPCHFPDFTREATRAWWAERVAAHVAAVPLDGLWVDMNEPSLGRTPTKTLPESARHAGDGAGGPGDHARFHNLYGQLMAQATHEGLRRARPERRPFVLTRSSHVSGARFAATWTGDNQSRWEDLRWSIPMVLGLGLSGQPFAGPDAGGFAGDPSPELFARWMELAAFLPFFRGHAERSSRRKEPWTFGPEVEARVRRALHRRLRLLPLLETLFHDAARLGLPVARPLFFADPADPELRAVDDAFLLGDSLLVAPLLDPAATSRTVRLPRNPGGWFPVTLGEDGAADAIGARIEAATHEVPVPPGTVPLFARAGSILVTLERASFPEPPTDLPWRLLVLPDLAGRAAGHVHEDDGTARPARSLDLHLSARLEAGRLHVEERAEGSLAPRPRHVLVAGVPPRRRSAADGSG